MFTICEWLVPFAFFVSLSANDNTLPSTIAPESTGLLNNRMYHIASFPPFQLCTDNNVVVYY